MAQMKDEINSQEYPSKTDIFVYEHTLARAYLLNESFDQAKKILIKLTKNDPTFIPGFILLADTYLEKGHPKAAEFIIKRGLQNNLKSTALQLKMSNVMVNKGHYQTAYKWTAKAIKINRAYTPALSRANISLQLYNYLLQRMILTAFLRKNLPMSEL